MTKSRELFVADRATFLADTMGPSLTIEMMEKFANSAEKVAHEKSREMSEHFKDDEMALTRHADHMRTVAAKIKLLRDGLVPALKIDRNSHVLRLQAVQAMTFVTAEFEAMTGLMR
ncbi:MAG TPA: hypothetical protein VMR46_00990 [Candidatus Paceibacterota bacterium]|nr:hypothetical protein [Candidatus Paceibacterota bacterium]